MPLGRRCDASETARLRGQIDPAVATHLLRLYGADAPRIAAYRDLAPEALERIHPGGPDIWAQVDFARDEEWALTTDDVLARRTTLAFRGRASPAVVESVGRRLSAGPAADGRALRVGVG